MRTTLAFILLFGIILVVLGQACGGSSPPPSPRPDVTRAIAVIKADLDRVIPETAHIRVYEGNKSYTVNKQRIYLCARDSTGKLYPRNALVYVLVHELAHVLCPDVDHTSLFHRINSELLDRAIAAGMYDPSIPFPSKYCQGCDGDSK